MKNLTISLSDEQYNSLKKKYPEVNWSEIARRAFINYVNFREGKELIPYDERYEKVNALIEFTKKSKLSEEDLIVWMCRSWLYTPSEAKIILNIVVESASLQSPTSSATKAEQE